MWTYIIISGIIVFGGWALMNSQYRRGQSDANKVTAERTTDALIEEVKRQNIHLTDADVEHGLRLWAERLYKT